MSIYLTHRNPFGITLIIFRLVWRQIRALSLPKLCLICSKTKFYWQNSTESRDWIYPRATVNIEWDGERFSHRIHCHSLCNFLLRCNLHTTHSSILKSIYLLTFLGALWWWCLIRPILLLTRVIESLAISVVRLKISSSSAPQPQ